MIERTYIVPGTFDGIYYWLILFLKIMFIDMKICLPCYHSTVHHTFRSTIEKSASNAIEKYDIESESDELS
jgi:hypothetical protein